MKLIVDKKVFEEHPDIRLGVVVVEGLNNSGKGKFVSELRGQENKVRKDWKGVDVAGHPMIAPWREIYRQFGSKPSKYRSSIEALVRRVAKGGELSDINPLVNMYNYLSLKYIMPFGGEDLDRVRGDIRLTYAKGDEAGIYLGSDEVVSCDVGEIAYLDELGFICRKWNWREGRRTMLSEETDNVVLVTEAVVGVSDSVLREATEEMARLAESELGGRVKVFYLDSDHMQCEWEYDGGRRLSDDEKIPLAIEQVVKVKKNVAKKTVKEKAELIGVAREIGKAVEQVASESGLSSVGFVVERPGDENHGDYSTNIAMVLFAQMKDERLKIKDKYKSPREMAGEIAKRLGEDDKLMEVVEKIEVAGAGFINLTLKTEYLVSQVKEIMSDTWEKPLLGKNISVEYTDPNPFKEFHIGHLYSNLIGESIARLYEANGATVWRGDFYGDVGMHIAKSVWGMMQNMDEDGVTLEDLEKQSIKERQSYMGQGYAKGVNVYEEDPTSPTATLGAREEIKNINYMIYVASQEMLVEERGWEPLVDYKQYVEDVEGKYPQVRDIYQAGLKWSLAYFETYYERLGTKFDGYYPESYVGELGLQVVEKGLEMGVLEKGDGGAVVYHGEKDGLHTRVFRNKIGLPTYEAKDLGLVKAKYMEFPFDYSLNVFGQEIDEYYKVVKRVMEQIEPELGKKQEHLAHGMVNLPEGKMSSRKGNVITVEWLLNEARNQAYKLIKSKEMSDEEKWVVAEQVGQGAVKYALLRSNIGDNVTFDFGQSVTFDGASGPYIQYSCARARSVLTRVKRVSDDIEIGEGEVELVRWLSRYSEVVVKSAEEKSPSTLAMYLYELASKFNTFYNSGMIVGKESREWVTDAVARVLASGLGVLGIEAPESM